MIKTWLNDLNTTNFRITVSVFLAAFGVIICLIGVTWIGWEPSVRQERLLLGIAAVVLTMMGFDVLQFVGKRFSDAGLAAAKNSALPPPAQVAEQNGDTKSSPSSLTRTMEQPIPVPVPGDVVIPEGVVVPDRPSD